MGTHPIFESDFDCLTGFRQNTQAKPGFEPGAPSLRVKCSTTELFRRWCPRREKPAKNDQPPQRRRFQPPIYLNCFYFDITSRNCSQWSYYLEGSLYRNRLEGLHERSRRISQRIHQLL